MRRCLIWSVLVLWLGGNAEASNLEMTPAQQCAAGSLVIVGTVTDVDSEWAGPIIMSDVALNVERVIHGSVGSNVTIRVPSGTVSGLSFEEGSTPLFKVGERYLLVLATPQGQMARILGQGAGAVRLDPEAVLASQASMVAVWEDYCDV